MSPCLTPPPDAGLPVNAQVAPRDSSGGEDPLPAGIGTTPTAALVTSAADLQTFFGVAAPAEIDFATEHALFYSAGSYPLGAGNSAVVSAAVDTGADVAVTTVRTSPAAGAGQEGADCSSAAVGGVDLVCAGLSPGGDWGLCTPTSMWGTFKR